MYYLVRQSGFYLVALYCLLRLYEMLWAQTTFSFMLQIVMAASACYIGARVWMLKEEGLSFTLGEQGIAALLLALIFAVAGQYAFVGSMNDLDGIDTFTFTFNMLANSVFWLFAGASMALCRLRTSLLRALLLMLAVALIVAHATDESGLFVNYGKIIEESELQRLSHLTVAEFAVFLIFISYVSARRLRVVVFLVGVAVLFSLGGRSSLYFTIFSVAVYEVLRGGVRLRVFGALTSLAIAIAILFFLALHFNLLDEDSKFVQQMLFTEGIVQDESYAERQYINSTALGMLTKQVLFGDPTLIASHYGYIGSYLHNLLSAWQFFGLPTFAVMVALLWASWKRMRVALAESPSPIVQVGSLLLIYTLVSVIFSKYVGFRFLWVSIGFWMVLPAVDARPVQPRFRRRKRTRGSSRSVGGHIRA